MKFHGMYEWKDLKKSVINEIIIFSTKGMSFMQHLCLWKTWLYCCLITGRGTCHVKDIVNFYDLIEWRKNLSCIHVVAIIAGLDKYERNTISSSVSHWKSACCSLRNIKLSLRLRKMPWFQNSNRASSGDSPSEVQSQSEASRASSCK